MELNEEQYKLVLDKLDQLMVPNPDFVTGLLIEYLSKLIEEYEK